MIFFVRELMERKVSLEEIHYLVQKEKEVCILFHLSLAGPWLQSLMRSHNLILVQPYSTSLLLPFLPFLPLVFYSSAFNVRLEFSWTIERNAKVGI